MTKGACGPTIAHPIDFSGDPDPQTDAHIEFSEMSAWTETLPDGQKRQSAVRVVTVQAWSHSTSVLDTLEDYRNLDGSFLFRMVWPELSPGYNVWYQVSNLVEAVDSGPAFTVTRGSCRATSEGYCIQSPNYPLSYDTSVSCVTLDDSKLRKTPCGDDDDAAAVTFCRFAVSFAS